MFQLNAKAQSQSRSSTFKTKPAIASSVFHDESENEEDEKQAIQRANQLIFKSSTTSSSIFENMDYSSLYDDAPTTSGRAETNVKASGAAIGPSRTARYITGLKVNAQLREKEQERMYERRLIKEREAEDCQNPNNVQAPKFVTSAYKRKLLENQRWDYEDRLESEVEKRTDVRGVGMEGFYAHLLTKNIALGGDVSQNAISAHTAGSLRQRKVLGDDDGEELVHEHVEDSKRRKVENDEKCKEDEVVDKVENSRASVPFTENVVEVSTTIQATNIPEISNQPSVEDKVAAARNRYLSRKTKAETK